MTAQPWSNAQARNNKAFASRLDKVTGWLVDGDWHGSFCSWTEEENDSILNFSFDKEQLPFFTLEFSRVGEALKAVETRVENGETIKETFIVGVQPFEKTFYMFSTEDNDLAFGQISRKSNTINVTKLAYEVADDGKGLGIFQFTNLA
jgi:hypothetical protein